uniref:Large ribosomal subunit protein bL28c n=1 Tax=Flintiella sanguinaria TaxID=101926 RepID=A0A1X9PU46_9RHOD|nr:50S ribosomal protein L28 [Flintiella sanguinaria]
MTKKCRITGKIANNGFTISRSHIRTHKLQYVNLQLKRIWDDEKKKWIKVKISTKALRNLIK